MIRRSRPQLTILVALWGAAVALSTACPVAAEVQDASVRVVTSILPQQYFVQAVGGPRVEVAVLVGPGHSPATYEPTPKQMAVLEGANLFLAAGVPFELGLVPRIRSLPKAPYIAGPEASGHDHHHDADPHTWLDPAQAMAMGDTICARLAALDPAHADAFASRNRELAARLEQLDREIRTILEPYAGRAFFVFHPAFGHFAAAYGLVQVAVEDHGREPGARQLAGVIDRARDAGVKAVITQPQFSRKSATTVADAVGAEILVLDPLAYDYEKNLLGIAKALAGVFQAEDEAAAGGIRP